MPTIIDNMKDIFIAKLKLTLTCLAVVLLAFCVACGVALAVKATGSIIVTFGFVAGALILSATFYTVLHD